MLSCISSNIKTGRQYIIYKSESEFKDEKVNILEELNGTLKENLEESGIECEEK